LQIFRGGNTAAIIIQDAGGRIVKTIATNNFKIVTIDISSLSIGIYFIKNGIESVQFLKQ
jgi:hypothetical protein